jgi:hypothetical protein
VITAVPGAGVADTPVTMPVPAPTEAIAGLLLLHTPPEVGCVRVRVWPSQTESVPTMADGAGVTVTTTVDRQPAVNAYVMVAVPGATPVTTPVVRPTVAMPVLLLVQVPPVDAFVSVIVEATQTLVGPTMGAAAFTTVTTMVTEQPATR